MGIVTVLVRVLLSLIVLSPLLKSQLVNQESVMGIVTVLVRVLLSLIVLSP